MTAAACQGDFQEALAVIAELLVYSRAFSPEQGVGENEAYDRARALLDRYTEPT